MKSWVGKFIKKQQGFSDSSQEKSRPPEGKIFINRNKKTSDSNTDSIGEYVDYEEVD